MLCAMPLGPGSALFGGDAAAAELGISPMSAAESASGAAASFSADETPTRKRKSRWGSEQKAVVPGMPTMLPSEATEEQRQMYLLQMTIEDCTRKLKAPDLGIDPDPMKRSPSPEPVYDHHGRRLNTREVRTRQKIEKLRHDTIQHLLKVNPIYRPPIDYKPPVIRMNRRVFIPQEEHPEINFVGLLIGPRGLTLKSLEKETSARIIIRGRGSVKEGKLRPDGGKMPGEDEPLHAYITAGEEAPLNDAEEKIKELIQNALDEPGTYNSLRRLQLRELALLNGTVRPEDLVGGARCSNCGADTHKTWECPEATNVTQQVVCTACGASGHIARDCKNPRPGGVALGGAFDDQLGGLDDEYTAFMSELGQGGGSRGAGGDSAKTTQFKALVPPLLAPGPNRPRGPRPFGPRPGQDPIMRVNLAARTPHGFMPPPWFGMPPVGVEGKETEGTSGAMPPPMFPLPWMMPGMMPPPVSGVDSKEGPMMSAEGGMVPPPMMFNSWGMGMPMPVPPPPGSSDEMGDSDLSALMAPPPPPPPPPPSA